MDVKFSEQLMHCTIRIEAINESANSISTGTGFFFLFNLDNNRNVRTIVTNKHVIENANKGRLTFTVEDEEGNPKYGEKFVYEIDNFEKSFILHPNIDIDLCILPIENIVLDAYFRHSKKLFLITITKDLIPNEEQINDLSALEQIVMVGYPNGLWDHENNLPIIRQGITAIHPKFDYNNQPNIVLDMACFPGSSGSPVFIFNEGIYTTKSVSHIGSRVFFLGILHSGPQINVQGKITMVTIPTTSIPISETKLMINIGYAVKSRILMDFKELIG